MKKLFLLLSILFLVSCSNYNSNENDETKPIIILNKKVQNKKFDINSISTDDIKSVNVYKDKAAIERFGNKGVNGVIEIYLKDYRL